MFLKRSAVPSMMPATMSEAALLITAAHFCRMRAGAAMPANAQQTTQGELNRIAMGMERMLRKKLPTTAPRGKPRKAL